MSEIKVNKITPRTNCGTTILGDSGDTFTVPAGVSITNSGTATGFGASGAVDWQTGSIKTTDFTAATGEGYFVNTTSGPITVTLPAGVAGYIISVQDYANTFDDNGCTLQPNGSEKINGGAGGILLSAEGEGLTIVYVDGVQGWRSIQDSDFSGFGSNYVAATGGCITTCGDYKIHTFNSPATFTVTAAGSPAGSDSVEYLVVAGGGGAGASYGGGGGAGGFRFASPSIAPLTYPAKPLAGAAGITVSAQPYPIQVGGGGTGSTSSASGDATKGNNSIFSSITSAGGGVGGSANPNCNTDGGSGGGGSVSGNFPLCLGTGNQPPVSPPQGNNGGAGYCGGCYGQGGGGGAEGTGGGGSGPAGGNGGAGGGLPTAFGSNGAPCGSYRYYSGGGAGGRYGPGGAGGGGGCGGIGGGGAGSTTPPGTGNPGTCNTGGGGGGAGRNQATNAAGGNGGSGIVVLRYKYQN
tara:strand:- start:1565 stop:2959 length:1395 start_codon:yes stop_codon:yes gene_type:complete